MTEQWKNDDVNDADDRQMPLGVSGDAGAGEESFVEPRAKINASTLGLFAAFGAALLALYLLGLQNKPRGASAEVLAKQNQTAEEIDALIRGQKTGETIDNVVKDTRRLVSILMTYLEAKPPAVTGMDNVFALDVPTEVVETPKPHAAIVEPEDPMLLPVYREFKNLKLQMVMLGNPSHAMVNNQIITIGSKFTLLTVKEIQSDGVVLTDGKGDYRLRMNAPSMDKN